MNNRGEIKDIWKYKDKLSKNEKLSYYEEQLEYYKKANDKEMVKYFETLLGKKKKEESKYKVPDIIYIPDDEAL